MKLNFFNKGFIALGTLLVVALAMPFASTIAIKITSASKIYDVATEVPKSEAALVLGAAAYPARLSAVLQDRVDTAIELYEAGKVEYLIMSGAPNEVEGMTSYAIDKGVDSGKILGDEKGLNTLASIKNIAEAYDSIAIVTQKYHLPRAIFIARHFGMDAVGISADKREYDKIFDFKKRELLATTKAMLDLFLTK